jgi:hypothetical protein
MRETVKSEVVVADQATANEADEVRMFWEILRHSERTLADMIFSASVLINGIAVAAELELEDGTPEADVLFVKGRYQSKLARKPAPVMFLSWNSKVRGKAANGNSGEW